MAIIIKTILTGVSKNVEEGLLKCKCKIMHLKRESLVVFQKAKHHTAQQPSSSTPRYIQGTRIWKRTPTPKLIHEARARVITNIQRWERATCPQGRMGEQKFSFTKSPFVTACLFFIAKIYCTKYLKINIILIVQNDVLLIPICSGIGT